MKEKFCTAINCMDGRIQVPVIDFLKSKLEVDFVDIVTVPGPNKILSEGLDIQTIERIKSCVGLSVKKHGSMVVAVSAHEDCAGNPVDTQVQLEQLLSAVKVIKSWNFKVKLIALWINKNGETKEISTEKIVHQD